MKYFTFVARDTGCGEGNLFCIYTVHSRTMYSHQISSPCNWETTTKTPIWKTTEIGLNIKHWHSVPKVYPTFYSSVLRVRLECVASDRRICAIGRSRCAIGRSMVSDTLCGFAMTTDSAALSIDSSALSIVSVSLSIGNNYADLRNSVCSATVMY